MPITCGAAGGHQVLYDAAAALRDALPPPGSTDLNYQKMLEALDAGHNIT